MKTTVDNVHANPIACSNGVGPTAHIYKILAENFVIAFGYFSKFEALWEITSELLKTGADEKLFDSLEPPDCKPAVPGLNPAISPAYTGLPILGWAAIWDGTPL